MVFKCFDEVDKTAWLYFLFAGIKPDFVDFFHTFPTNSPLFPSVDFW